MHCLENSENNDFFLKAELRALALRNVLNSSWTSLLLATICRFQSLKKSCAFKFLLTSFFLCLPTTFSVKEDLDVIGLFEMKWLPHFDANNICKMTIQPVCHSNTSHALTTFFLKSHLNYLKLFFHEILFQEIFSKYSSY